MIPANGESSPTSECIVCEGADLLQLGVCARCACVSPNADTMVFISASGRDQKNHITEIVARLLPGEVSAGQMEEVLAGERPLFLLPNRTANKIVEQLAHRSIATRLVPKRHLLHTLPLKFYGLLTALLATGTVAGLFADSRLLFASPAVAVLLWLLAFRVATTPMMATPSITTGRNAEIKRHTLLTLTNLTSGTTRKLLTEVIRAGGLFRQDNPNPDARLTDSIGQLTRTACDAAEYLAALERQLDVAEEVTDGGVHWDYQLDQMRLSRDRMIHLIEHATTVIHRARSQLLRDQDRPEEAIVEATEALRHQIEAREDVEALLAR